MWPCLFEPSKWLADPASGRSPSSPRRQQQQCGCWLSAHWTGTRNWTHSMDRRCNIDVDPDAWPIKAQMGTNEEASAGALSVLSVLPGEQKETRPIEQSKAVWLIWRRRNFHPCSAAYRHRVLHVGDGGGELAEVQLRAVDKRVSQVAAATASAHARDLPLLVISHHGSVVLPSGDALDSGNRKDYCHCFCAVLLNILASSLAPSKYEALTHLSACQSCHVQNNVSWQIFAGVHHSISQNQPAFSISVVYLHSPSYTNLLVSHSTLTWRLRISDEGPHLLKTPTTYSAQLVIKTYFPE